MAREKPPATGDRDVSENREDEALIIGDQDETGTGDEVMGGMGTEELGGPESAEFARGEIDTVAEMDRVTRIMDHATGRGVQKRPAGG